MSATKLQAVLALKALKPFIGHSQWLCIADAFWSEEKQWFFDRIVELKRQIDTMPKTYEQDGKGEAAVVHLHYFKGGFDWWITEKDAETPDEPGQHQAFGLARMFDDPELGYISITEITAAGAELDLHWTPCTIGALKDRGVAVCI